MTTPQTSDGGRFRGARAAALSVSVLGTLLAFLTHFRPWEVGFMEEWPLAADWGGGGAFTSDYLDWTLSRPLHLVPSLAGLAIAGGAPGGIFLVLGLVASAQFLAVLWALRPLSQTRWVPLAAAAFAAFHPLWPGGYLQRFLPAQTAALALVVAVGFLLRWLLDGRTRAIIAASLALVIGLCVYPGPAAVAPLAALVLALALDAPWWRRIIAVAATTGASAQVTLYSLVITRLIAPDGTSYEAGNIAVAAVSGPREFLTLVGTTYLTTGMTTLAGIAGVLALGAALALTGIVPARAGWLMAGAALASPATTVVFFGHVGWLQDIDRIGYTTSLALAMTLLVWPARATARHVRLQAVLAALVIGVAAVGAVRGIQRWQPYIELQHRLLAELAPVVRAAEGDDVVIVVDRSGTYGTMFTFPLQYLDSASQVMNDDDTTVKLCFDPSGPYPIPSGGTECERDELNGHTLATTLSLSGGPVDIYLGRQETDD